MDCPKCTGTLNRIDTQESWEVQRCDQCQGLWGQPEAFAKLRDEWMSEALIDVGSPIIGEKFDALENVACPLGHGVMNRHADEEQRHIYYEQCSACSGIFLDAGEFTDLKFKTLLDWVRGLMVKR